MHGSANQVACELAYFYWSAGVRVFKVPLLYLSDVRSRYPACVSLLPIKEALPSCFVFIISLRWIFILRSNCTIFTLLICCITSILVELGIVLHLLQGNTSHWASSLIAVALVLNANVCKFWSDLLELKTFCNRGEIKFVWKISIRPSLFYATLCFSIMAVIGNQRSFQIREVIRTTAALIRFDRAHTV